jgi:hypothetical protein
MPLRHPTAARVHRGAESHKYLEIFIWMLIALVLFVMIRFVLMGPVLASMRGM